MRSTVTLAVLALFCLPSRSSACELTDYEVIRSAVAYYLVNMQPSVVWNHETATEYATYETVEELYQANPDCCRLEPHMPETANSERIRQLYGFRGVVYIETEFQPLDPTDPNPLSSYYAMIPVDNCGNPVEELR